MNFNERVMGQINLLNDGKPLEAIDEFFSDNIIMYDNDHLFAKGKSETRTKQEPFITSAKNIEGKITDILIDEDKKIVIFRNKSKFMKNNNEEMQIDGLCHQVWENGYVITEHYYSGQLMLSKIEEFYKKS